MQEPEPESEPEQELEPEPEQELEPEPEPEPEPEAGLLSFVNPIGYQATSCGYCAAAGATGGSFYLATTSLSVDHYQTLLDRGWRRSGNILYKPDLQHACCPHYTIRLPVSEFQPSKDQRRVWNRWNRFVLGDDYIKEFARLHPKSKADKARQRMGFHFDLVATTYEAEFERLLKPLVPKHRFEVTLEPDTFTEEKFAVYKNYQINVHHDPPGKVTPSSFKRFLCSSPFRRTERTVDGIQQKLGGFHQLYRLDGRLIAMGVIDLLPHCVSGVYFIYHQDFEKWGFGKLSALREASLAIEGKYGYYYMGFYIHSCPKMTYKNEYKPQYFLDLETYDWNPLDAEARRLMDTHHYLSMAQVAKAQEKNRTGQDNELDTVEGASADSNNDGAVVAKQIEQAIRRGTSLFHLGFPGMLTMEELEEQIDLDKVQIRIPGGMIVPCEALLKWHDSSVSNPLSLKGIVGEVAGCVGPGFANDMIVDMS